MTIDRPRAALFVLIAAVATACGGAWYATLRSRSNVIERDAAWTVMKREVIYHASAYEDFLRTPIGKDGVNLWLGQGWEGLRWNAPAGADVRRIDVDARLDTPQSYLHVLFRSGSEGSYSVLFSRNERFPSGFYRFAPSWEALSFTPMAVDVEKPFRATIALAGDQFQVLVDGRPVAVFRDAHLRGGTVGVKGGFFPTHVRAVEIDYGLAKFRDTFDHRSARGFPAIAACLALFFAVLMVFAGGIDEWTIGAALVSLFFAALQVKTGFLWAGIAGPAVMATVIAARSPRPLVIAALLAVIGSAGVLARQPPGVSPGGIEPQLARGTPVLRLGQPLPLATQSLGDQRIAARIRLAPGSVVELRFWSPSFRDSPDFHCTERWHAVVLSTEPAVGSGIYRFDAEPQLLAPIRLPSPSLDLRVDTSKGHIVVRDGARELATASAGPREAGAPVLYLFAGAATVDGARANGIAAQREEPPNPAAGDVEQRVAVWAIAAMLLAIAVAAIRRPWRGIAIAAAAAIAIGGLAYALLGTFGGPFRVVQLEMMNDVPPTPYAWLWYRHPSFRACNQFLHFQRFGGREVPMSRLPDARRLVAIGASQTFGFGASSAAASWPAVVARELAGGRWDVVNAGVPGSYTVTARSWFDGVLRHYRPDAVVIDFCAADYLYLSLLALEGRDVDTTLRQIESRGMRLDPWTRVAANFRAWRGFRAFRRGAEPDRARLERAYEATLERLVQSVRRSGAEAFVVLEPKAGEVSHPILDYPRLYPIAVRVAERNGATVIDPTHSMSLAEQGGIVWWDYAHPTDYGYEVLGREIADAVQARFEEVGP